MSSIVGWILAAWIAATVSSAAAPGFQELRRETRRELRDLRLPTTQPSPRFLKTLQVLDEPGWLRQVTTRPASGPTTSIVYFQRNGTQLALCSGDSSAAGTEDELAGRKYLIRIFYATDRARSGSTESPKFFGGTERGDNTYELGECFVSIPLRHQEAHIERPRWWEWNESMERHIVLVNATSRTPDEFFSHMRGDVERSGAKHLMLFIHGYNVTFEEAAWRIGQIVFDMRFDGASLMYSWPSRGDTEDYIVDAGTAERTAPRLARYIQSILDHSGAQVVHVVAHSMGTRILSLALKELGASVNGKLSEVVMAAADIDRDHFSQNFAQPVSAASRRVTLYSSENDLALIASQSLWQVCRLGRAGPCLITFPQYANIDVIDASIPNTGIFGFGHSYYGDSKRILADLKSCLAGTPASDRGMAIQAGHFQMN